MSDSTMEAFRANMILQRVNANSVFMELKAAELGDDCAVNMDYPFIEVTVGDLSLVFVVDLSSHCQEADIRLYKNYKTDGESCEYIFGLSQNEITHISMLNGRIVEKARDFVHFCRTRIRWS